MKLFKTLALAIVLTTSVVGCNTTTPTDVAYKAEGSTIILVDKSMQAWHDYVVAGNATQSQVDSVKNVYTTYYNAQVMAKLAFEAYYASKNTNAPPVSAILASTSASNAEAALLNLIQNYMSKK